MHISNDCNMMEEVTLMIEGVAIKCVKEDLVRNSDYFRAMFEGNFSERDKSVVTLQDIPKDGVCEILSRLRNPEFIFTKDNLVQVLETACILQFLEIRDICITQLADIVSPSNALEVWFAAESLSLRKLYLQAKFIALSEFNTIKDTNLSNLSLEQVQTYLGNAKLQTESEMDVFGTIIRWYSENCDGDIAKLKKLLHCIDFNSVSEKELKVMQMNPSIAGQHELHELFDAIIFYKTLSSDRKNVEKISEVDKSLETLSQKLLNSNPRTNLFVPAFYTTKMENGNKDISYLLMLDLMNSSLIECHDVPNNALSSFEGIHLISHKEKIYIFREDATSHTKNPKLILLVYNTIQQRVESETQTPFGRQDFISCICGSYLYIVIDPYDLTNSFFCYNLKTNVWSKEIELSCQSRQLRCCNYYDQLLVVDLHATQVFIYENVRLVAKLKIINAKLEANRYYFDRYTLHFYRGKIFLNSDYFFVELKLSSTSACLANRIVVHSLEKTSTPNHRYINSIICKDVLLTIFTTVLPNTVNIEKFNMITYETTTLQLRANDYIFDHYTKCFKMSLQSAVETDLYVNGEDTNQIQ